MRLALAAGFVVAVAATGAAASPSAHLHPCRAPLLRGPPVPAPIVLWDSCGAFRLQMDGHVRRLPHHWLARHGSGTGRRYGAQLRVRRTRAGVIIVQRGTHTIWRSSGLYPHEGELAFGPGLLAFSTYVRGTYLTDLRSPERRVVMGRGLYVLDFTRRGTALVVGRARLTLVARSGRILRQFRYSPRHGLGFEPRTNAFFFVTPRGVLARATDTSFRLLRRVPESFGSVTVERTLLVWYGVRSRSITVTTLSGRVIASARWRRALGWTDLGLRASADGLRFAYRVSRATAGRQAAQMSVYLLRPRAHRGTLVLRHRLEALGCGAPGGMSWHAHDLLYAFGDGRVVAIDADSGTKTDLSAVAKALPRRSTTEDLNVAWASDFAR